MEDTIELKKIRKTDPFLDRRGAEDRREAYDLDYFRDGGAERREQIERRQPLERREGCIRVSEWSSICPDENK